MSTLILMYHKIVDGNASGCSLHWVSSDNFREQMIYLKRSGYPVVPWKEMVSRVTSGSGIRVGLTFDDGSASDLESARILNSLGYSALFFIPTEYLDKTGYLTRKDVRELCQLGMGIGSHAHHHIQLVPLASTQVENELRSSKTILEEIIQAPIDHLSFPGGSYDARILDIGRKVGYKYFYTSDWGVNTHRQSSARVLRRTAILNSDGISQFEAIVQLRNYYARQLGFQAKELAKKIIGIDRYFELRNTLLKIWR